MLELKHRSVVVRMWNRSHSYGQIARRLGVPVGDVERYLMARNGWPHQVSSNPERAGRFRPRPEPSLPTLRFLEDRR